MEDETQTKIVLWTDDEREARIKISSKRKKRATMERGMGIVSFSRSHHRARLAVRDHIIF
jgi:hypothetical protein